MTLFVNLHVKDLPTSLGFFTKLASPSTTSSPTTRPRA